MTKTISKVAKALGINIETVRFYERKGQIEQPQKPDVGYRYYSEKTIDCIRFIKHAQQLGFTLAEIANLLTLNDHPCYQVHELAQHKLSSVQKKLSDLEQLEKALQNLVKQCQSNDDISHCPIIDSLRS